jgi:hypothetical protein
MGPRQPQLARFAPATRRKTEPRPKPQTRRQSNARCYLSRGRPVRFRLYRARTLSARPN